MKPRRALAALAAIVGLLGATVWLGGRDFTAQGSALSLGPGGWLATRRYLEARGARVSLLDTAEARSLQGVLVLTFPWQRFSPQESLAGLNQRLYRGGTVVLAYSGSELSFVEAEVVEALGLASQKVWEDPPLHPLRWREAVSRDRVLRPDPGGPARGELRLAPARRVPVAPALADVLYRDERGLPAVFSLARGKGRLVVLPAEALSNARLGQPAHADLLESLLRSLGDEWIFDEYHHGLTAASADSGKRLRGVMDLYLLHVALLYGLALLAVARRFGPAWSEPPVISGSAGSFLLGLGAAHDRLGHYAAAARLLGERALELDPRLRLPEAPPRGVSATGPGLLAWAQDVGRSQSKGARA